MAVFYFISTQLIPWRKIFLENFSSCRSFPSFYEIGTLIIIFTRSCDWFLPYARSPNSLRIILTLPFHLYLCFPSGLFLSSFPSKVVYEFHASMRRHITEPPHFILHDKRTGLSVINVYFYYPTPYNGSLMTDR